MTSVTQNIYTGLSDFADCALLLHLLREDSLFVDIGANVGIYTVLAAGVVGAQVVYVEPVPKTFSKLCINLRLNNIENKVSSHNIGLGLQESILRFTSEQGSMNHVIEDSSWTGPSVQVPYQLSTRFCKDYHLLS
jgi:FkbM family methyltransferase